MSALLTATDDELRAALADVNVPTLLMVLVHLTGDHRYLEDPFLVSRGRGLDVNDSGGLAPEVCAMVVEDTFHALRRWRDQGCPEPERVTPATMAAMMTACVGEAVAAEYVPMIIEQTGWQPAVLLGSGGRPRDTEGQSIERTAIVIGAGMSGILAGIRLGAAGVDYVVLEKDHDLGGTWLENSYPGCGVDTPGHLYSFSFEPWPWAREYPQRNEVQAYLRHCADKYGVTPRIRFGTEVFAAGWEEEMQTWRVRARDADGTETELTASVLISAVGQLNRPAVPDLPGLKDFAGPACHTAAWPTDLDLTGKRIAVVGTGASAMQLVPAIVDAVREVTVYQRSPQWASPNEHYRRITSAQSAVLFDQVPFYQRWYRFRLFWMFNDKVHPLIQKDPDWPHPERAVNAANDKVRAFLTSYVRSELGERQDLLSDVLPAYPPFAKRMLQDCGWYSTMTRDDVVLCTDRIERIEPDAVVTAGGTRRKADVLVFATGFQSRRMLHPMHIEGRGGLTLREVWGDDDATAFLGITVPDFPNLFCLYGPNTNPGHGGSVVFQAECQMHYVVQMLRAMGEKGAASIDVRRDAHDRYVEAVDAAHDRMIWTHPGTDVWYRNARGRVVTNTPWRFVDYWRMTREPDLGDYLVRGRARAGRGRQGRHVQGHRPKSIALDNGPQPSL